MQRRWPGQAPPRVALPDAALHRMHRGPHMREIELLVEAYLLAERALVAAVDAAGGTALRANNGETSESQKFSLTWA